MRGGRRESARQTGVRNESARVVRAELLGLVAFSVCVCVSAKDLRGGRGKRFIRPRARGARSCNASESYKRMCSESNSAQYTKYWSEDTNSIFGSIGHAWLRCKAWCLETKIDMKSCAGLNIVSAYCKLEP